MDIAFVFDEAQFPEFVHGQIYSGPRRADHLRQHFLRHFGKHAFRMAGLPIAREEEQSTRQPFFAGVEELVYQGILSASVSFQAYSR